MRVRSFPCWKGARQLAASIFAGIKKNQGSISDGGMGDRDRRCAGQIRPKSAIMVMEGRFLNGTLGRVITLKGGISFADDNCGWSSRPSGWLGKTKELLVLLFR